MEVIKEKKNLVYVVIMDTIIVMVSLLLPIMSHVLPVPLYYIEPIRLLVIISLLIYNDKRNALVLAVVLPFVSFIVTGHPIILKTIIMVIELVINVVLFDYLIRKVNVSVSVFLSIIISKFFYYGLKYLVIYYGIMNIGLISTPIYIQLLTAVCLSMLFLLLFDKK